MNGRGLLTRWLCASCVILSAGPLLTPAPAAEPGELFPNVKSYDDQVPEPVTKPEKSLEKPRPPVTPRSIEVPPAPPKTSPQTVGPVEPPAPPPVLVKPIPRISWAAYRDVLLAPLMSDTSQTRFDKQFAPGIQASLHNRGAAAAGEAEILWKDGQIPNLPADLKRVLWLHALGLSIRDSSKLDQSAAKAKAVLPLLTDETLPVAQARVDAVTGLAFGALSKASDDLLNLALESECQLTHMQVQCGFPDEAQVNGKLAHDIYGYIKDKSEPQKTMLAATEAWVERARQAQILSPKWQDTLKKSPNDPEVNTQLAILSLSLFGDIDTGAAYAAKSGRKVIKEFATVCDRLKPRSKAHALLPADTLTLAGALLDVAEKGGVQPVDVYSIGTLAQEKLGELAGHDDLPPAQIQQAHALQARAQAAIARCGIKMPPFTALAALQNPTAPGGVSKMQLFVKDNGTVVRYVKPTASENVEALKLVRAYAAQIGGKADLQFVEVETDHCLVFTDWETGQRPFLKKNVEGAYVSVAKAFDYPLQENVFPGKLPVFMLANQPEFLQFTKAATGREAFRTTGQFGTTDSGIGYVLMYQPEAKNQDPEILKDWGRTLIWNMSYAFEARYRSNKQFPTWLNQGLAAHLAYTVFPSDREREAVHDYAEEDGSLQQIFHNASNFYSSQSVCASLVQMLMARNKKSFVEMMNKLKDGETQDAALQEAYHWTTNDIGKVWKNWVNNPQGGGY